MVSSQPRLSPLVRRYLLAVGVSRVGAGLTLPFTLILLHEVRGIALPTVGLLLAAPGVIGLASVPLGGGLIDRWGPRTVLRGCMALQAVGTTATVLAHTPAQVLPALIVTGLGFGPSFAAGNALLTGLVAQPRQAGRAFAVQFTVINGAISVGTLLGALVVDVRRPWTFVVLFCASAATCLIEAALLPAAPRRVTHHDERRASYREVVGDPIFRRVCLVTFLFAMTGYAALDSGLPAFARVDARVSPAVVALAYTANTVLIVGLQLPVLRAIRSWPRTRALAVAALLWAVAWTLLGLAHTATMVLIFAAVFGLGEAFQAPALQPLVNSLASDRLRGRYNALSSSMYSMAFVISPAVSALLIGKGLGRWWIGGLCVGSLGAAVVSGRLRHRLSAEQDGIPVRVLAARS